jgi:hypothetical protein
MVHVSTDVNWHEAIRDSLLSLLSHMVKEILFVKKEVIQILIALVYLLVDIVIVVVKLAMKLFGMGLVVLQLRRIMMHV